MTMQRNAFYLPERVQLARKPALTLTLSPRRGNGSTARRMNSPNISPRPTLQMLLPIPTRQRSPENLFRCGERENLT
jgi:hypothetical protein